MSATNKDQLLTKTKRILSKNINVQLDKIISTKNKIIVKCHKQSNVESTVKILSELNKEKTTVAIEKKFNPRLRVVNVDYEFGEKDNQIIANDII